MLGPCSRCGLVWAAKPIQRMPVLAGQDIYDHFQCYHPGFRHEPKSNLLPSSHQSGMSHSAWKRETTTENLYPLATVRRHADGCDFQRQISQRKSLYASAFCRWNKTESVDQVRLGNVKRRQRIFTLWQHSGEAQMGTIFSVRTVSTSRYIPVSFVAGTKRDVRLNSSF